METKRPIDKVLEVVASRGYKQNALADALGIPDNKVSKWKEEGEGKPTPYQLLQAARWLGVPVDYFLDHQMTEVPPPAVTDDEWLIIRVYRALREGPDAIDHEEAIRRLSGTGATGPFRKVAEQKAPPHHFRQKAAPKKARNSGRKVKG